MKSAADITAHIVEAVRGWRPEVSVRGVVPLTPDASLRRYFRIDLAGGEAPPQSAVAMWFDSTVSPEASGGSVIGADESYVLLTEYFQLAGVAVPKLYFDDRVHGLLLIEDLGDTTLSSCIAAGDRTRTLFEKAIDQIIRIQSAPVRSGFFACERSFTAELYSREMSEFEDFLLSSKSPGAAEVQAVAGLRAEIAEWLGRQPKVLSHRDYHGWNLLVSPSDEIRVIDFQDALLATTPYDLVSLLNDRDMDSLLGREVYTSCVHYFRRRAGFDAEWLNTYDRVLLQRDLKGAGRFAKLVNVRGLEQYGRWIPGTVRRIGSTLERMVATGAAGASERRVLDILTQYFIECAEGAQRHLRWGEP